MKKILFYLCISSCVLFANLEDYRVGTWNLQGSSAATESKWSVSVRQLIVGDDSLNVLAVQEAGAVPASAQRTGRQIQPGGTPVEEYIWQLGTSTRPRSVYIYYSNIDVGARRVNLAIVSDRMADEVIVVRQTSIAPDVSRPALGIRIGNDVFFNIHALASGGGDASALVTAVHDHFSGMPNVNWMILGDFNRDPASLRSGLPQRVDRNTRIVFPGSPTHFSSTGGRVLDYAVIGRTDTQSTAPSLPSIIAFLMTATVRAHLTSDHFPVRFGRL